MNTEPDNNASSRRSKANIRVALLLVAVVAAIYFGFILSHL